MIRAYNVQGLYVITDLSGTFWNTESNDGGATVTRTGNLRVSLAGPDCKVVCGCVCGMLVAGSQVEVTIHFSKPFYSRRVWLTEPFKRLDFGSGVVFLIYRSLLEPLYERE